MFGKRSSGPQAKTKSVEQADAIDEPLEKVELSKEKLTEIQATAADASKPTQPPPGRKRHLPIRPPGRHEGARTGAARGRNDGERAGSSRGRRYGVAFDPGKSGK